MSKLVLSTNKCKFHNLVAHFSPQQLVQYVSVDYNKKKREKTHNCLKLENIYLSPVGGTNFTFCLCGKFYPR